ncbi:succinate dehydrogenase cytochrome b560 subunit, mitochondrial-like [Metopolophium dirhodum]|uniref:succinate dehydrogenase cytochrome b560 subunit, mitochondrial-like n=1 Tax=Metopolophium dirhodum TaxID=44670 RepID=UPI00298FF8BD|nr:succinate dehydrogenase cytochrome b560 subunit, mitochondrial-like [Metopolophium dirhodum]
MALYLRSVHRLCTARQAMSFQTPTIHRMITMQVKTVQEVEGKSKETHDDKNNRLNRPMSPHLTIYKPQLTTMLSITHRGTGVALSGVTAGLGALFIFTDLPTFVQFVHGLELPSAAIMSAKGLVAYPFFYHLCNGIRHLVWDAGKCLTIKQVYSTGYGVIVGSLLLTVLSLAYTT